MAPTSAIRTYGQRGTGIVTSIRILWVAISIAVGGIFIALWQIIADARLISPVFLPGPDRAWSALVRGLESGVLWTKVAGTVGRMIYGWLLASIVGIALGALIGS